MELEKLHSAYALRRELSKVSTKTSSTTPVAANPLNEDAVKVDLSDNGFKTELYKHIKDHYDGKGYLSRDTGIKLSKKASSTQDKLSQEDPKASSLYAGYLTANLSYGSKARFVDNINNAVRNSANIRKAYSSS
jgi:hypothetical protein